MNTIKSSGFDDTLIREGQTGRFGRGFDWTGRNICQKGQTKSLK